MVFKSFATSAVRGTSLPACPRPGGGTMRVDFRVQFLMLVTLTWCCYDCHLLSSQSGEEGMALRGRAHGAGEQRPFHRHLRHVNLYVLHHVPLRTVSQTLWRRALKWRIRGKR
ncbi:hypothetical protein FQN60_016584 [Etheostoma spectabile]|uniref:Uncharacterized protein n=1 Tax=Etheostoma spectabile TaxID=54343 RepID=A0A5J5CZC7_9PERO|nr:hypothetical protein FQN60_016584 [Etheostoma spectabile]